MGILHTCEAPRLTGVSQAFSSREIENLQQGGSKVPLRAFCVALGHKFQALQGIGDFIAKTRQNVADSRLCLNLPRKYNIKKRATFLHTTTSKASGFLALNS